MNKWFDSKEDKEGYRTSHSEDYEERNYRQKKPEQSLFWYGFKAGLVKFVGILIIVMSIVAVIWRWWAGLIIFILGVVVFLKGKAMRFEYKMKSGVIIHGGDR